MEGIRKGPRLFIGVTALLLAGGCVESTPTGSDKAPGVLRPSALVVAPSGSSLKMKALANAVSNDFNAVTTVTDVESDDQIATFAPLSVAVQAQSQSASGQASVVATGSAMAMWSDPAEGQVQWAVNWVIVNIGAPGGVAGVSAIAPDEGWRYTFTPDQDGTFTLDFSITADFTIGINPFNFLWPGDPCCTLLPPNTTGTVTRPVIAGTEFTVALTNNSGVSVTVGNCCASGPDASMTATFNWRIEPLVIHVEIDIKPGSFPNSINLKSGGRVPVAILSAADFDAPAQVHPTSLTFGRTGDEASLAFCTKSAEDVNGDGLLDLVCHFNTQQTGFQSGDTEGILKGRTADGTPIEGRDGVRVVS